MRRGRIIRRSTSRALRRSPRPSRSSLNQLAADSKAYLLRVWPRTPLAYPWHDPVTRIPSQAPYILEGQTIMTFFLAGPVLFPNGPAGVPQGFSTNPSDPILLTGPRKGPYFQFVQGRLSQVNGSGFAVYYDAYSSSPPVPVDKPYLYFSSGGKANGYNAYALLGPPLNIPAGPASDCATFGVWPYLQQAQSPTTPAIYYKPATFQIVCAGRDQVFGQGCGPPNIIGGLPAFNVNTWQPSLGAGNSSLLRLPNVPPPGDGLDDQSNFYNLKLGTTP